MHRTGTLGSAGRPTCADGETLHFVESVESGQARGGPCEAARYRARLATGGHPVGLYVLCAAELFERFAGYLFSVVLVMYLNERAGLAAGSAARGAGYFGALSYALAVGGGLLADRLLGLRAAVFLGTLMLCGGFAALTLDRAAALGPALALLVAGNALFKPNSAALVGALYEDADPRRDAGYRLFHLAINAGALLGPVVGGALRFRFGWGAAFGACTGAMCLASLVCVLGWRTLRRAAGVSTEAHAAPAAASARKHLGASLVLFVGLVVFLALLSQTGSTLLLWARDSTRREALGYVFPPDWFASLACVLALLLLAVLPLVLRALARVGVDASPPRLLLAGLVATASGFVLMTAIAALTPEGARASALGLSACYVVLEIGEVTIAPAGMSLLSKLAPARWTASAAAGWFVASALGQWLGGELASLWGRWAPVRYFALLALLGLATVVLIASCMPWLARVAPTPRPST